MNNQYPQHNQYPPQNQRPPQQAPAPAQNLGSIAELISQAGGVKGAFEQNTPFGTTVQGEILEAEVRQSIDYKSGQPESWDDGNPKLKLMIVVQTGQIDPMVKDDDGKRAIWVKWWGEQRKNLLAAIRAAGDDDIRVGGYFAATLTGDKPNDNPKLDNIKLYEYYYTKPTPGAGLGNMPGGQELQAQPPQQVPAQEPQYNQGGQLPGGPQTMVNNTGQAQPVVQAPPVQAQPPVDVWTGQAQAPAQQAPPVQNDAAAQALQAQQANAQAQAPAQAPPQAAPAGPAFDEARVRQFIGLGLTDQEVAASTGATLEQVQQIRATA